MGGSGTAGSHWEKRLVANEFMNPQVADNPVLFSALTLALFEDTGWYKPNYGAAQHLPWGYKQGKYSKRRRSNIAVIIVRILFISSFVFKCLL